MEGVLLKWTNYWNGWQTRWFVLHDGILSYYRSAEDVNQGCKGSVKVSAIQIAVSNVDSTRMDLSIPGEKNLYLKAPSPQERQLWLVALGSAKACVTLTTVMKNSALDGPPQEGPRDLAATPAELRTYCDILMQQVHALKTAASQDPPNVEKISEESKVISVTCDSFIRSLEHCMELTKDGFPTKIHHIDRIASHICRPTVPVMRTNSTEKKA
ncbi:hypothetical protein GE061_002723 [Apolygus lucorum]|uniref:Uncharacterized protein n=1 Tax=Apolygus lucorum TaxID=248454 RepID=A0A6A4JIP0_APOLU|nr:hypothetical protein GE061_002723 [Apolygus lucorum]